MVFKDVRGADFSGANLLLARLHRMQEDGAIFGPGRLAALGTDEDLAEAETWEASS